MMSIHAILSNELTLQISAYIVELAFEAKFVVAGHDMEQEWFYDVGESNVSYGYLYIRC
jgi:hypothetical protein